MAHLFGRSLALLGLLGLRVVVVVVVAVVMGRSLLSV